MTHHKVSLKYLGNIIPISPVVQNSDSWANKWKNKQTDRWTENQIL